MTAADAGKALESFFGEHRAVTMKLPNGWFGRPYDFVCRVVELSWSADCVVVALEGPVHLVFTGPVSATVVGRVLELSMFRSLFWERPVFGTAGFVREVFAEGTVEFIAVQG